jgi:hypothetical protein
MLRKSIHLHVVLTCLFLCLSFTAVAYADPITLTQDFKPLTGVATISSGAILVSSVGVESLLAQNANWTLSVNIKLVNDATLGDMISLEGTMEHGNNNPDDGQHQNAAVFNFTVMIKPTCFRQKSLRETICLIWITISYPQTSNGLVIR